MVGPPNTGWRFCSLNLPARRSERVTAAVFVCGTGHEMCSVFGHRKVTGFFNKIQVTCVGAHVDEFVINESDHALIYIK
jgi:hypothetical protein